MFGFTSLDTPQKIVESQVFVRNIRGSKYLSPSSIESCSRYLYYHLLQIPAKQVTPVSLQRLFDRGIDSEERLGGYLEKSGLLVARQVDVYNDDPPIHGKIDFLYLFEDELGIIEHTTKDTFAFKNLHVPPRNKVRQWNLYSGLTGIHKGYVTVDGGMSMPPKWFPVTFDERQFDSDLNKFWGIRADVLNESPTEPEEQFYFGSEACLKCPYFQQCWSEDSKYYIG